MVERNQNISFTFKILNNRFADQWVSGVVQHLFHCHQLDGSGEMQVPGAVDRAHSTNTNHILNGISAH